MNPRNARSYETYHLLGMANFVGKQYSEGIRWALRSINEKPAMHEPYSNLVRCYVGANDIAKARAAFAVAQALAPEAVKRSLEGSRLLGRPEDRKRSTTFFRIAAGLEDPGAAEALR